MNRILGSRRTQKSQYVQAVPIFLSSDTNVLLFFRDYADEIDNITSSYITVLLAIEIRNRRTSDIVEVIDSKGTTRFPGLTFGDLPCLWIEDEFHRNAILKLPHEFSEISQFVKILSDICRQTKDVPHIKRLLEERLPSEHMQRSSFAKFVGGLIMNKSQERLIAVVFGAIFVATIIVIALFVPNPSPFQYTVFRIVLAIAAAGFVSMTPGFISMEVSKFIRAGGALAVFVIVFFYAPAAIQAVPT